MGTMGTNPNGNGGGDYGGGLGFRKALFAVQLTILAGLPASAFWGEITHKWQWTPTWERIYYVTVASVLLGLGILRLPQIIEAFRLWRGGGAPPPAQQ